MGQKSQPKNQFYLMYVLQNLMVQFHILWVGLRSNRKYTTPRFIQSKLTHSHLHVYQKIFENNPQKINILSSSGSKETPKERRSPREPTKKLCQTLSVHIHTQIHYFHKFSNS